MDDTRQVCGYLPRDVDAEDYAASHFLVADPAGPDSLYENTLPVHCEGDVIPTSVIAADLAVSSNTRERSGGLRALEDLRQRWLAGVD
ncbi:hypothetical protein ACIPVB_02420 [Microbacterium sp. NPDC090007]|uniref:hypothetical protein n=1 Tax=Microbacterium sp. NPDC090007 TaxID=3364204 RepID=UPI003807EFFC